MRNHKRKTEYKVLRFVALMLIAAFIAVCLPAGTLGTRAAAGNDYDTSLGVVKCYEWHRVNKKGDLPPAGTRCPVLILWKDSNTIYYANGGYVFKWINYKFRDGVAGGSWAVGTSGMPDPFSGDYRDTNTFITKDVMTSWEMSVTGDEDTDNEDAPQVRLYPNKHCILTGYNDFDFPDAQTSSDDHWSIYTSDLGGDYGKSISAGQVKIYANVWGADTGFMHYDNYIYGYCHTTYDYHGFVMYWGEERNITAITDDYYVTEGQVLNVDDGVMLAENTSIIVEPGGVLSIEGTFNNNGTVENRGTMILQENACVCCSPKVNSSAGRILCSGATVNMRDYADTRIAQDENMIDELNKQLDSDNALRDELQKNIDTMADDVRAAQEKIDKLRDQKDKLDLLEKQYAEDKAANKDVTQLEKDIQKLRDEYNAAYADPRGVLDNYNSYLGQLDSVNAEIQAAKDAIENLEKEIGQYKKLPNTTIAGEGNLVLLSGSKLVLGDGDDSGFTIEKNANVTCHGYIISPHMIQLSSAKLKICEEGALLAGYRIATGSANIPALKPSSPKTLSISFYGQTAAKYYAGETCGVLLSGNYVFEVNGVFVSTRSKPAASDGVSASPNYGKGLWK